MPVGGKASTRFAPRYISPWPKAMWKFIPMIGCPSTGARLLLLALQRLHATAHAWQLSDLKQKQTSVPVYEFKS